MVSSTPDWLMCYFLDSQRLKEGYGLGCNCACGHARSFWYPEAAKIQFSFRLGISLQLHWWLETLSRLLALCPLAQLFGRLWSSYLAFVREANFASFDEQFLLVHRWKGLCLLLYAGETGLLSATFIAVYHSPQLLHWRQVLAGGAQDISLKRSELHFGNFNQRTVIGNGSFASGSSRVNPTEVCCLFAPSHIDVRPAGLPICLAKICWRWEHRCCLSQSWLRAASCKAEPICEGQHGS